jgi:4-hydroxy-tetrahydrodipicolinate synthase
MTSLCLEGDFPGAVEVHRRLHALMEINFIESNPGPVKAAMAMMGLLEPVYRLPVVGCRPESLRKIEKVLLDLGLIPSEEDEVEVPIAG